MKLVNQVGVKVSVIIPVYNHAPWVITAVKSVLEQSLAPSELILIDDASTDNSWQVVADYCASLPTSFTTIHYEQHASNQGAPATLNQALRLVQGEYIAILNSDDCWSTQRLARLVQVATAENVDFIFTDVNVVDAQGQAKEVKEPHWLAHFEGLKQDFLQKNDLLATLLRGNMAISTSNFFFHKRVYEVLGEFTDLRYVHDYHYLLRVLLNAFKVKFLFGEKLLDYRLHNSNTIREQPRAAIAENMRMLLDFLPDLYATLTHERLSGLRQQLQELYRYTEEEWLTAIHWRLVAKEQELFALVQDRDKWIAERDSWIQERDTHITQQAQQIDQLTTHSTTLQLQIHSQAQELQAYEQTIQQLQHTLEQYRQWLTERDSWVADRDVWIVQRDRWIAERDYWLQERDALILQLQQKLNVLQHSRAFRLGNQLLSPWRRVKQWSNLAGERA